MGNESGFEASSIPPHFFESFKLVLPSKPAGRWILPGEGVSFMVNKKPRWITIRMMWLVFEWKYEELK